jgi:chemotaxis protein MotB
MDRNKYRVVSGSLKNAFGIQRKKPVFESPKGQQMIAREFDQAIVLIKVQEVVDEILNEMEDEFQEFKGSVDISIEKDRVAINLMGKATFDSGSAELREEFKPLLLKIGGILTKTKGEIIISGHTDNVPIRGGRFKSNLELSMARAGSVAQFLLRSTAVKPQRLSTRGYGEYRPLAPNNSEAGKQKNRRVEIIVPL